MTLGQKPGSEALPDFQIMGMNRDMAPKTPVVQAKPERQICRHKKRNILKTTYPVLISQSELFFHLSEGSGKAGHLNFISLMRCAILIG